MSITEIVNGEILTSENIKGSSDNAIIEALTYSKRIYLLMCSGNNIAAKLVFLSIVDHQFSVSENNLTEEHYSANEKTMDATIDNQTFSFSMLTPTQMEIYKEEVTFSNDNSLLNYVATRSAGMIPFSST